MRLLTIGEIVALADTVHPRYRALVFLAGTGGLRMGELGALRGRWVDLRRGTVEVVDTLALGKDTPVIGPVKTKASRRTIALPRQTVTALGNHIDAFRVGSDDFVFTSARVSSCGRTSSVAVASIPRRRPGGQSRLPRDPTAAHSSRLPGRLESPGAGGL